MVDNDVCFSYLHHLRKFIALLNNSCNRIYARINNRIQYFLFFSAVKYIFKLNILGSQISSWEHIGSGLKWKQHSHSFITMLRCECRWERTSYIESDIGACGHMYAMQYIFVCLIKFYVNDNTVKYFCIQLERPFVSRR